MEIIFTKYKKEIEKEIDKTAKQIKDYKLSWSDQIIDSIVNSAKRGKMIRGGLVLLSMDLYNKKINQDAIKIAAALEFLHSALLIHDDIMDHDDLRRGIPSIHKEYQILGRKLKVKDYKDFGISMAICIGDIAIFASQLCISEIRKLDHKTKSDINKIMAKEFLQVGFGQIQDLGFSHVPQKANKKQILEMYLNKTARYTFSMPLIIGATLSKQNSKQIQILDKIGENLGLIFQLTDDSLSIKGNSKDTGKKVGNDLSENKQTLYNIILQEKAKGKDQKEIKSILGKKKIGKKDIATINTLISKYKTEEDIRSLIESKRKRALNYLKESNLNNQAKETIKKLSIFLINRTK